MPHSECPSATPESGWRALGPGLRSFGRRRRAWIMVLGSLTVAFVIAHLLAGRRDEFQTALSGTALWLLGIAALLQLVALLSRSEAWHLSVSAAGGTVDRRTLYRASSLGIVGTVVQGQLAVAARIAMLRRTSPELSPQVPTLVAAELPILVVEA